MLLVKHKIKKKTCPKNKDLDFLGLLVNIICDVNFCSMAKFGFLKAAIEHIFQEIMLTKKS